MSRDYVHLFLLRHQENERVVSSSEPVWSRELINIAYARTCHTLPVSNELSLDFDNSIYVKNVLSNKM